MITRRDLMKAIQKSYEEYNDEELYKMILSAHLSRWINRDANEGLYAAEELIERLQKRIESLEAKIASNKQ